MGSGRLSIMILSVFVLIGVIVFFIYQFITVGKTFFLPITALIGYLIYIMKILIEEFINIKNDKKQGVQKSILKLYEYKIHFTSPRDNIPPIAIATFQICGTKQYIALSGDYSKIEMDTGKYYLVRYYKYSKIMVDINTTNKKEYKKFREK